MPYEETTNTDWKNAWQDADYVKVPSTNVNNKGGYEHYKWDATSQKYTMTGSYTTRDNGPGSTSTTTYNAPSDGNYLSVQNPTTDMSGMTTYAGTGLTAGGAMEGYTYTGGSFDPSSDEFKEAMKAGNMTDLLQGYGITSDYYKYFDDVDMNQLNLINKGYSVQGRQAGRKRTSNLMDIREEESVGVAQAGMASSGTIASKVKRAEQGVWADFTSQKQQLAVGWESDRNAFWQAEEDDFYNTIDDVEAKIDAANAPSGSCFTGDSPILMSDGSKKQIKDIIKGDKVRGWGNKIHTVVELRPEKLADRKLYGFNGGPAFFTEEHPLMTIDGWKSLNPAETKRENPTMSLERFQVGDVVMGGKELEDLGYIYIPMTVTDIHSEEDDPDTDVYNIHLSDGISFHIHNIPFHTVQSGVVVDKYAEEGLSNLSDEDKQRFATAFSTVPGLMDATGRAFGSTFIKIFRQLGA